MQYLTHKDLLKITGFLYDNDYIDCGITIETEIATKEMLDKINEDFFYRYVKQEDNDLKPEYGDVVTINMNGVKFRYKLSEDAVQGE
jgi:hypothetical protein